MQGKYFTHCLEMFVKRENMEGNSARERNEKEMKIIHFNRDADYDINSHLSHSFTVWQFMIYFIEKLNLIILTLNRASDRASCIAWPRSLKCNFLVWLLSSSCSSPGMSGLSLFMEFQSVLHPSRERRKTESISQRRRQDEDEKKSFIHFRFQIHIVVIKFLSRNFLWIILW